MDPNRCVFHSLFRESTTFMNGQYVKDLSKLNRDLAHVIIIDDNPESFQLQPENGIRIKPFKDSNDVDDNTLLELIPLLEGLLNVSFSIILDYFVDFIISMFLKIAMK